MDNCKGLAGLLFGHKFQYGFNDLPSTYVIEPGMKAPCGFFLEMAERYRTRKCVACVCTRCGTSLPVGE